MATRRPCKAKVTYEEAVRLLRKGHCCGAANRTYYSLYQATVALFDRFGYKPQITCRRKGYNPKDPSRWPHACVIALAPGQLASAGNTANGRGNLLQEAYALRIQADYTVAPVEPDGLEVVLERVPRVLDEVGKKGVYYQGVDGDEGTDDD